MKVASDDANHAETFVFSDKLDSVLLKQNYKTNIKLAYKIFDYFTQSTQAEINKLVEAANNFDYTNINNVIHKVKNNFLHVGLSSTYKLLVTIAAESNNQNPSVKTLSKELDSIFTDDMKNIKHQLTLIIEHLESNNVSYK